jgi:MOSC domain-containing protein YiiM/ferredoxin-NADP reductase
MVRLLSVNVGLPRDIPWQGKTVHTAVWKAPVQGPRVVRRLNIDGDGQGDLLGHGGEHRAVFVYQMDSYRFWQSDLGRNDFSYGQFGENFTVDGLPDREVCIGDRYRIGSALFEVTQPRVTCYRVGIRMNEPQMPALLVAHGRPGFYLRVLEEGEVEAGDEIVQVGTGPERMTIFEINALLYMPGHPSSGLERALRVPALSAGWRRSLAALLAQAQSGATTGNAGLGPVSGPPPAWAGFRPLRVSQKIRESSSVMSLVLEPADELPLAAALPGQFVVLRLTPAPDAPALMRSYSLSGEPSDRRYRLSIKREPHGVVGAWIDEKGEIGDVLDVSAPRGNFTLRPDDGPVVLLSAGVGAPPVIAMLHALAAQASPREVWWLHGARHGREHPFAQEAKTLLKGLAHSHRHIRYSLPDPEDRPGVDFDAVGTFGHCGAFRTGRTAQCRLLYLRATGLHQRPDRRPCSLGRRYRPYPHRAVRPGCIEKPGRRHLTAAAAAFASRAAQRGTAGFVRPQRLERQLGVGISEHPRACRSVRHPHAVGVPHGCLSQL